MAEVHRLGSMSKFAVIIFALITTGYPYSGAQSHEIGVPHQHVEDLWTDEDDINSANVSRSFTLSEFGDSLPAGTRMLVRFGEGIFQFYEKTSGSAASGRRWTAISSPFGHKCSTFIVCQNQMVGDD